jgi:hypothetical protein
MRMFHSTKHGAFTGDVAHELNGGLPMAPRGLFDRPITDTEEAVKGETTRALVFGLVAALVIALMVLVGMSGENAASHLAQLSIGTPGTHIF